MTAKKDAIAGDPKSADPVSPVDPIIVIGVPDNVQPVFMRVPSEKFAYSVDGLEFRAGDNTVTREWLDGHADHSDWLYGLQTGILVPPQQV